MWGCKSSLKLLVFMVPLVLVSGIIVLSGVNGFNSYWTPSSLFSSYLFESNKDFVGQRVAGGTDNKQEALADDYNLNRSSSPALSVQAAIPVQPPLEISNNTKSHVIPQSSSSDSPSPTSSRIQHTYSSLDRLEASLRRARAEIGKVKTGNRTNDPDYVPQGPMYRNAAAFHRSYLEMEKLFKVYVYEEGEPPVFHNGPCKSIYSMEGNFIYQMENSQFRTRDPDKAHAYFLPMSITTMVHYIYVSDSHDWQPMKQTVKDYVGVIAGKYPYWNRSEGADHFMVACHDWGPAISGAVPELFGNSIRGLCNANTSEGFRPSKDVSIPEILLPSGTIDGLIGGPSASQRPILAFFAGGVHGPVRPILLEHWEGKDTDVQVHKYLPKGVSYYGMLKKSKYCICPSGYEVASPRMVEALYTGCVPVIVKDHYVAPFSDVLNWKSFSVEVSVKDIPNLKKILTGISTSQYIRMQRRGKQVRRHFEVSWPPKRYDVFHMILHSIWLRRLNLRVHAAAEF
ncbi:hypothetical protein AG4045_008301 [Apium graveolens]|uniref:Exostosin GT47 domain-containing protein n=1 Tax=Apium graveolens TaxID=4045 RepID=A0A6L5B8X7_APIGR|nr:hypothetical protein AG4045_008301 [Apium graveolens]